ncbi:hypothetical protein VKT23_015291 [Stygiomarasmius scandens]|uniref:Uncharacterized protein n=1 Tax=Marasmiellus scandens TaxID=2682957 RepID=A0ABR1IY23_9AGAR
MGGGHHDDHGKQWDGSDDSQKGRGIFEPSGRKKDSGPPSGSSNATCIDDTPTTTGLKQANQIFFIIANMLGDGILIYRVFHIWDRSARVTYVPVVASVINNIMGLVSVGVNPSDGNEYVVKEAFYDLYLILNIVLNLFLTGLIAGRVWYIRRQAQLILKEAVKERYNTAIVVCVESGILYPLFLIIFLSLELSISSLDFFPILVQAVGIAPTLITFRSSLGLSMDSVDQVVQSRLSNVPPGADIRRGWGSARSAVVAEGGYSQGFFGYPSVQRGSGMGASGGRESSLRNDERNSVR